MAFAISAVSRCVSTLGNTALERYRLAKPEGVVYLIVEFILPRAYVSHRSAGISVPCEPAREYHVAVCLFSEAGYGVVPKAVSGEPVQVSHASVRACLIRCVVNLVQARHSDVSPEPVPDIVLFQKRIQPHAARFILVA